MSYTQVSCRSTVWGIFKRRWIDHIRKQIGVIRSVVDLTVALYILIPGILLLAKLYYELLSSPPAWLVHLPFLLIPLILMMFVNVSGGLILYQEAADMLFLRQNKRWQMGILRLGCTASLLIQALVTAVAVLVVTPALLGIFHLKLTEIALLYMLTAAFKAAQMLVQQMVQVVLSGWTRNIVKYAAAGLLAAGYMTASIFLQASPVWTYLGAAIFTGLLAGLIIVRFRMSGTFLADVREDMRQMTRLTAFVLSTSVDKPRTQKAKPFIFRASNRLFRSRKASVRVAEAVVKSFYRSGVYLRMYAQFVLFSIVACVLPPFPVNVFVYFALIVLLAYWMNGYCRQFFSSRLMKMLPVEDGMIYQAMAPSLRWLILPCMLVISAALGVALLHVWWAAPLFLVLGFGFGWWVAAELWMVLGTGRRRSF
ncbi:ABC transporter permease [Paenibacillus sp. J22TS3]|uniref:ABC transporter permease n=1 Tax=Paenibacillus sp. J22TS3 TaxID=2807192 RepID=UPI001B01CC44|nr:ABC transporter permease [Paenibacillus sp. J22TS3]GIP23661.1 ABC transporter permease [Paenibacillus sp. J22TS3]